MRKRQLSHKIMDSVSKGLYRIAKYNYIFAFVSAAAPKMATSFEPSSETRISTLFSKVKSKCLLNDSRKGFSSTSPAFTGPPIRKMASGAEKVTAFDKAMPNR